MVKGIFSGKVDELSINLPIIWQSIFSFFLKRDLLSFVKMCVGMFTCMMVPMVTEEDTEFPDAEGPGKCEPSDELAGNRIHDLCKSINCS